MTSVVLLSLLILAPKRRGTVPLTRTNCPASTAIGTMSSFWILLMLSAFTFGQPLVAGSVKRAFYKKTEGFKCGSIQDAGNVHLRSCAVLCTQMGEVCSGFGHNHSRSQCKLCLFGGPLAASFSSDFALYSIVLTAEDMQKGQNYFCFNWTTILKFLLT